MWVWVGGLMVWEHLFKCVFVRVCEGFHCSVTTINREITLVFTHLCLIPHKRIVLAGRKYSERMLCLTEMYPPHDSRGRCQKQANVFTQMENLFSHFKKSHLIWKIDSLCLDEHRRVRVEGNRGLPLCFCSTAHLNVCTHLCQPAWQSGQ